VYTRKGAWWYGANDPRPVWPEGYALTPELVGVACTLCRRGDLQSVTNLSTLLSVSFDQSFEYCRVMPYRKTWEVRSARAPHSSAADFFANAPSASFDYEEGKLYTLVVMDPLTLGSQSGGFVLPYLGP
jgi:hypothetical protein